MPSPARPRWGLLLVTAASLLLCPPALAQAGDDGRAFEVAQQILRLQRAPEPAVDEIVNRLVFLDHGDVVPALARLLASPDTRTRIRASYALGFFEAEAAGEALRHALEDSDWEVRRNAAYALGRSAVRDAASALAGHLEDPKREVRLAAARALRELGVRKTAPALLRALETGSDDLEFEVEVVRALGATGHPAAGPALAKLLDAGSEVLRIAALEALVPLGHPEARRRVERMLSSPSAYTRTDAARLLAAAEQPWARSALAALLEDPEPRVRLAAAESLGMQGDERGLRYLLALRSGDDARAALSAADALSRAGVSPAEIEALQEKMRQEEGAELGGGVPGLGATDGDTSPRGTPPPGLAPRALAAKLKAEAVPFQQRLEAISAEFKGVPYLDSPLGEGAGVDPDPLLRFDAVDCLTYVEQVLALANAPSDPLPTLNAIRYTDGRVAFGRRNHLMIAQWIPNNIDKGFVRDITEEVGGKRVRWIEKDISRDLWVHRRGVDLPLRADEIPQGIQRLPIVPIEDFPEVMDRIPDGALLLVVRRNIPARPYRVTHLGFVFRRGGTLYLRHAAKAGYGKVVDERLATFVRRNAHYRKWPVEGFNLLLPVERSEPVKADSSNEGSARGR